MIQLLSRLGPILICSSVLGGLSQSQEVSKRQGLAPEPLRAVPITAALRAGSSGPMSHRLVVKFMDASRARAGGGAGLLSKSGQDLAPALGVAQRYGMRFRPLLDLPVERMRELEQRAEERSGRAQPDLAGIMVAEFVAEADSTMMERAGTELQALSSVEFCHIELLGCPPPDDIAPTTPSLDSRQAFLGSDPGVNSREANARGVTGMGVRVSDCEYGWNPDHEEFNEFDLHLEPGQTLAAGVITNGYDSHGTAVAGIIKAPHNNYGVDSIAPDCELYTYPEWTQQGGFRRVSCITSAIMDSAAGDIVLLEMQTGGPDGNLAPAELSLSVYLICEVGRDAGVVVVAAAGNGGANLNGPAYAPYRARGNSGAIIVGAGSNNTSHTPLSFSCYGARVDIQAWGQSVTTTGYGGLAAYGGDKNQRYTKSFSGTSSASAITSAAVALLQEGAVQALGFKLDSLALRRLMRSTGHPQGSGPGVGPAIDLEAALDRLPELALLGSRNGTGSNPPIYSSTDFPVIAGLWDSNFNTMLLPGATSTIIVANLQSSAPVSTKYGEILIGLSMPHLGMDTAVVLNNASPHSIFLPNSPGMIGLKVYTQGIVLGNGLKLTNAIDLTIGR